MPRFPDATGYLLELRDSVNERWFSAACDLALASDGSPLGAAVLEDLWNYFHGTKTYTALAATPSAMPPTPPTAPPAAFLEVLGPFTYFKKLSPSLSLTFEKKVTLVFGKNGSGKTSLCQALKVLAQPERPQEPLDNVHSAPRRSPVFDYRFRGAPTATTWSGVAGFGTQADAIKYFDSSIAYKHINGNVEPSEAVQIEVFRLETFVLTRSIVGQFHTYATQRMEATESELQSRIQAVKDALSAEVAVSSEPFASWTPRNFESFSGWLGRLPAFDSAAESELDGLQRSIPELVSASTEEGLRALRVDLALIEQLEARLAQFKDLCTLGDLQRMSSIETDLIAKRAAVRELSSEVFITGVDPAIHHALLQAAAKATDLSVATPGETTCPLCRQLLQPSAAGLFHEYHRYLTSNLQVEIQSLEEAYAKGIQALSQLRGFSLGDFSSLNDRLPTGCLSGVAEVLAAISSSLPGSAESIGAGDPTLFSRFHEVDTALGVIGTTRSTLSDAIRTGTEGRATLTGEIEKKSRRVSELVALKAILKTRESLESICNDCRSYAPFASRLGALNLPARLASLTTKGKQAHNELVLGTFEQRLNQEYLSLAGATMAQMGVRLASRGSQQDIIVTPKVGDDPVVRVLSEGEQKIHALAVFMCEATTTPHRILMFDDPVTSFDYNYSSNFCTRLRDLIRAQPDTQIILLTHSWHFFAEFQTVLNQSGLTSRLQVQVLEDCATVEEYVEEWDRLCVEINAILDPTPEPSAKDKERVAALLRRLIERVSNEFVFNNERHQYKNKNLTISAFDKFTKIVPLLPAEAQELKDLFRELSPPEHDDPRNFYLGRSRLQFHGWYARIVAVKTAVHGRRP